MTESNLNTSPSSLKIQGWLKEGSLLLMSQFDHVPIAIYSCDQHGYVTSFNRAAAILWGYSPELGKDPWRGSCKVFHPDGSPILPEHFPMSRTLKEGIAIEGEEIMIECSDGTRKNILAYPVPVFDGAGTLTGAIGTLIDITAQRTEERRKAILAAIIESSEDAIISKTLNGIITSWNEGARHIFGYEKEEVIGKHISILIPPEHLAEEDDIIRNIRNGNKVSHFQTVRVRNDGVYVPISLTVSPVKDSKGRIIGASKIARDITDQRNAEEKILQNSMRLEILNSIGKVISEKLDAQEILQKVTDATTNITEAEFGIFFYNTSSLENETFSLFTVSGVSGKAVKNLGAIRKTAVFHSTSERQRVTRVDDVTKDHEYDHIPFEIREADLPLRSYLTVPVTSTAGTVIGVLFFGHSQPDRFKLEHEDLVMSIASQAAVALDNSKLFEEVKSLSLKKDEFISLASHELKTPLTSINGYLQILARQQKEGKGKLYLEKSLVQIHKLNDLVNELLDISKIQAGKLQLFKETFDLKELIFDVIESLSVTNSSHEVILEYDQDELYLEADKQRIEQVLVNLLTNAVKYSPNAKLVILNLIISETEVTLQVKDYGIGITGEQQRQMFTQFYRAEGLEAKFPGLGLGLYISREIIERHHGRIWIDSLYGIGTTVSFSLPLNNF